MTKAIRNGLIDGLSNAVLLFLCGELIFSALLNSSFNSCIIISAICSALSIILFYVLLRRLDSWVSIYFTVGLLVFLFVSLVLFFAKVELHIAVFPHREPGYADGLVFLFCYFFYLSISEILRIVGCLSKSFNNTVKKKIT